MTQKFSVPIRMDKEGKLTVDMLKFVIIEKEDGPYFTVYMENEAGKKLEVISESDIHLCIQKLKDYFGLLFTITARLSANSMFINTIINNLEASRSIDELLRDAPTIGDKEWKH